MMKTKISSTGYKGVYKNKHCNTYFYWTTLSADPDNLKPIKVSGFKSAEEAYKAKAEYETETLKRIQLNYNKSRVGFLMDKYIAWKSTLIKINSVQHIKLIIRKYIREEYEDCSIEKFCEEKNLDKIRMNLLAKHISVGQKNKIMFAIRDAFEYGGLINYVNPELVNRVRIRTARLKDYSIKRDKDNENYWTIEEWQHFISVINPKSRWYVFFSLYGQLGCRIGEIRGLQNKHFDPIKRTIRIEQQAQSNLGTGETMITSPKTRNSVRTIEISQRMVDLLLEYQNRYKEFAPNKFLFFDTLNPIGTSTVRRKFDEYIKLANLPHITLHGIRHSNCTWLLNGKLTVEEVGQVSKRLGHASTKETLDIYFHIHKSENSTILNKLDNVFKGE